VPAIAVAPSGSDRASGERALDEVVVRAWETLTAHRGVACLVCGGEMQPEYGAQSLPIGARCNSCGTTLR
jgi:hypothetical protein